MGDMFQLLIPSYLQDTDEILASLDSLITSKNLKELERLSHSLKSSSRNLGASDLGAVAEQMEQAMREGNLQAFTQLRGELDALYSIVKQELSDYNQA